MFLKRCSRRRTFVRTFPDDIGGGKCGKDHVYWELVESVRTARGSRHKVVSYLGELSAAEERGWARLATTLDGKAAAKAEQLSLVETPAEDDPVPETVTVNVRKVRVERTRDFGDVYLALYLWRMLGLVSVSAGRTDPVNGRGRRGIRSMSCAVRANGNPELYRRMSPSCPESQDPVVAGLPR